MCGSGLFWSEISSISKNRAPGMWHFLYSAFAFRPEFGRCHDPSMTRISGPSMCRASQSVETSVAGFSYAIVFLSIQMPPSVGRVRSNVESAADSRSVALSETISYLLSKQSRLLPLPVPLFFMLSFVGSFFALGDSKLKFSLAFVVKIQRQRNQSHSVAACG